ncbi:MULTISPECIES: hypothetical protein [Pseudomonas syringae group]|uniref:Uncharacterized protein n=2 Tax=Pseudomonas syringae group TaxID=136849 RepID=A0A2K4X2N8_PSESX|nr:MULTISPECIES: hypothetical protein [Pseudomonas syringae group]AVB12392.1 hypothetical protein BKM19_001140 [Pseudomonas amygdali pv. morsprunorum]KWS54092.1 hypothetical protein AL056_08340 [Pseudomonas amygdali pv. morsprunorum]KWS59754.1 hypothetical protein AL054_09310 [Pseudomonas amygdali pv. morsprunorum]MBI6732813.1 hypothetical protein [Pseudomonas amygdali]MBI6814399.1 hypothetical protein [Pseudomonas amygdali]
MPTQLTEEEMRQALFGSALDVGQAHVAQDLDQVSAAAFKTGAIVPKRSSSRRPVPLLEVILRLGNEFEGETRLLIHEAHTLSTLQAELDAKKTARRKYKYVELVSIRPVD